MNVELENQALDNTLMNYSINLADEEQTVENIYEVLRNGVNSLKEQELMKKTCIKDSGCASCELPTKC